MSTSMCFYAFATANKQYFTKLLASNARSVIVSLCESLNAFSSVAT